MEAAMRFRYLVLSCLLVSSILVSGCSKKSSPTAPIDANASMYGTWNGTLTEGSSVYGITIVLTSNSAAFYLGGGQFPAVLSSLHDPNVTVSVTNGANVFQFYGSRAGSTMNGSEYNGSTQVGVWAATKQ